MAFPTDASVVVLLGSWWDESTRAGMEATITATPVPAGGSGAPANATPNLTDLANYGWIKSRSWVTKPLASGLYALPLIANDDPDLSAFGGYLIAPQGEPSFLVNVSVTATTIAATPEIVSAITQASQLSSATYSVAEGDQIQVVRMTEAAVLSAPAPQPPSAFLTESQINSRIATAIAESGGGGGGGGGTVVDATTTTKGVARLLGGTAAAPTIPASALTGTIDDARIPSGITRDSELTAAISGVIAGAPANLDTLDELAAAFADDANFAATVTAALGTKATTGDARALGIHRPENYGAVGNDSTNDAAAFQAMLDALPAAGGHVLLGAKTYRWTGGVTCSKPIRMVGAGHGNMYGVGGSRINYTPTTGVALTLGGEGTVCADFAIEHAAWQTSRSTGGAGIRFDNVTHCALDRVMVIGFWNNVECLEGEYYTITDCKILEFAHYGLLLAHDSSNDHGDQAIYGNHIGKFRDTTPGGTAVYWRSGGGVRFQNNKINAFGQTGEPNTARLAKGIHLDIADFTSTSVFPIVGNSIENFTEHGILITGNAGNIDKVTITANELASFVPGSVGIETAQSSFIYSFNCSANTINDVGTAIRLKRVREGAVIGNSGTSVYDYGIRCGEAVIKMDFGRNKWPSETTYPWFFDNSGYPPLSDNTFETTLFINSTVTPIDLFEIGFTQYGRGFVEVEITGGVDSVSANAYLFKRLIEANANGQDPGQVTIGTDVASGGNMTAAIVTAGQANPKCVLRITRFGGTNINLTVKVRAYGQGLKHVKQLVA